MVEVVPRLYLSRGCPLSNFSLTIFSILNIFLLIGILIVNHLKHGQQALEPGVLYSSCSRLTGIGTVRSHSCLRFLCGFPSISACQDLEMDSGFGESSHRIEHSCYFKEKSLAKQQASEVFWVNVVDVADVHLMELILRL